MVTIISVTTDEHYRHFASMVREYVEWSRERYSELGWFVDAVFGTQLLEQELAALSSSYGSPRGRAFLALADGAVVGCGAFRRQSDTICEMKRLFVRKAGHGRGTGRHLCSTLIDAARGDGFRLMRLDTAALFIEAISLYRSVGFGNCSPYHQYPADLMPHIVFMDMPLRPL
ncbi:GNAT family N-acetyltransferase [Rhizobium sp. Root1220]|uniref:GNAT family N-acetyltransferase n=1 Tax=Rhizobium sp. Root1220 TaxID=1736432 RepID=UPI0006FFC810|nr:GNAT family N-acetyltransferase [Rhizobium sp. Root1220]KQV66217.1 hypothetical protein ASC90_13580 [Rhizobium sp. Root1220]